MGGLKSVSDEGRRVLFRNFLILLFCLPLFSLAQTAKPAFRQDDIGLLFTKKIHHAARDSASRQPVKIFKPYFAITPFIGYNPAYGMLIGIGASAGMYLGDPATTPISCGSLVVNLTAKAQKIFNMRTSIFTSESQCILRGDWRFLIFSQSTYGLGSGIVHSGNGGLIFTDGGQTDEFSGATQQIDYDYVRFYETFYARITGKFYAGFGYCLDAFSNVYDHKLNLDTVPKQTTSHYKYSVENGFSLTSQTMSGLSFELLYDTRDHSIRPTRGYFVNFAIRPNFILLGSSKNSVMVNTEFRTYIPLSSRRSDHLLGFWYLGQFTQKGHVPYLGLPAIGWDMYNRSGRGYIQGSIRGVSLIYAESEYRFPISRKTGILGGVVFVNGTTASSDDGSRELFNYIDPAAGVGLRVMMNRRTLSNLTIDFGIGKNGTKAFYFNLNETF